MKYLGLLVQADGVIHTTTDINETTAGIMKNGRFYGKDSQRYDSMASMMWVTFNEEPIDDNYPPRYTPK